MARGRSGYARTPSREKHWEAIPRIFLGSVGAETRIGGALSFTESRTIVRCRATLHASIDTPADAVSQVITCGLGIVSTDAFAVGLTAMPDPGDELDYPWLWWGEILLQKWLPAGDSASEASVRVEVDTKAMRKVKPRQSLVWVFQGIRLNGTPITQLLVGATRVLIYE